MSFTLDCNHRDVRILQWECGPALHECTDAYRHLHGQAGPYISMQAPDTTGIAPNVTLKIVALTNCQRLSSNIEENRHESVHTIIICMIKSKGGRLPTTMITIPKSLSRQ